MSSTSSGPSNPSRSTINVFSSGSTATRGAPSSKVEAASGMTPLSASLSVGAPVMTACCIRSEMLKTPRPRPLCPASLKTVDPYNPPPLGPVPRFSAYPQLPSRSGGKDVELTPSFVQIEGNKGAFPQGNGFLRQFRRAGRENRHFRGNLLHLGHLAIAVENEVATRLKARPCPLRQR